MKSLFLLFIVMVITACVPKRVCISYLSPDLGVATPKEFDMIVRQDTFVRPYCMSRAKKNDMLRYRQYDTFPSSKSALTIHKILRSNRLIKLPLNFDMQGYASNFYIFHKKMNGNYYRKEKSEELFCCSDDSLNYMRPILFRVIEEYRLKNDTSYIGGGREIYSVVMKKGKYAYLMHINTLLQLKQLLRNEKY